MSVNDMWVKFKTCFVEDVEMFIPSKMTKAKDFVPWIDVTITQLVKALLSCLQIQGPGCQDSLQWVQRTCSEGIERCLLETHFQYIYVRER